MKSRKLGESEKAIMLERFGWNVVIQGLWHCASGLLSLYNGVDAWELVGLLKGEAPKRR